MPPESATSNLLRASRVLPAGTFGNVSRDLIIARGRGSRVWDDEGREYIDYLIGSGPMIIGHAHPEVNAAVRRQLEEGTTFFASNLQGIALAEAIVEAVPCAEQVRFCCTGSEADAFAMRLARAHTGREKILKFEGGYHGYSDYGLMSTAPARPGNSMEPIPDSAGIPASVKDSVVVAPYNEADAVESLLKEHEGTVAAVFMEPMQRVIPPSPGFLEAIRELTRAYGVLLVFDEVVTGFRLAYGGAQAYYGVAPDLCTLGKAIGGGFPLAAIAGREDVMACFDSERVEAGRHVPQVGTLSGNPVAAVAGIATLDVLKRPGAYESMLANGRRLMSALQAALDRSGLEAQVTGEPPVFDVAFCAGEIRNHRDMLRSDASRLRLQHLASGEPGVEHVRLLLAPACALPAARADIAAAHAALTFSTSRLANPVSSMCVWMSGCLDVWMSRTASQPARHVVTVRSHRRDRLSHSRRNVCSATPRRRCGPRPAAPARPATPPPDRHRHTTGNRCRGSKGSARRWTERPARAGSEAAGRGTCAARAVAWSCRTPSVRHPAGGPGGPAIIWTIQIPRPNAPTSPTVSAGASTITRNRNTRNSREAVRSSSPVSGRWVRMALSPECSESRSGSTEVSGRITGYSDDLNRGRASWERTADDLDELATLLRARRIVDECIPATVPTEEDPR